MKKFIIALHRLIGIYIAPFIFIAALTGFIYGIAYLIEDTVYKSVLITDSTGKKSSLEDQLKIAENVKNDKDILSAIRPGLKEGQTTKVLYVNESLKSSQYNTVFIDPYNLDVKAQMMTYGSGGAMPMRMWIDLIHKDLLMGSVGRWYSELAASWMWLLGLSGLYFFFSRKKKQLNHYQVLLNKHVSIGLISLIGLVFLSITGLTWSNWAGERIFELRSKFDLKSPSLHTHIHNTNHTDSKYELKDFDKALQIARDNNLNSNFLEIKPPRNAHEAWTISEIKREYPQELDSISIDLSNSEVIDLIKFQDFPITGKLTRWGIDLHMGTFLGSINQIIVSLISLSICILVIYGFKLWILSKGYLLKVTVFDNFKKLNLKNKIIAFLIYCVLGYYIPLIGLTFPILVGLEMLCKKLKAYLKKGQ